MIQKIRHLSSAGRSVLVTKLLRAKGIPVGQNLRVLDNPRISAWAGGRISIGANVIFGQRVRIVVTEGGQLTIEDGVDIRDYCNIECTGRMIIGRNAIFISGTIIYCEGEIVIGPDVLIAAYCVIADTDHNTDRLDVPIRLQGNTVPCPIHIGAGAWLGTKVTVTKGITIGEGAVIGANAVVTRDVPALAVAVGIPAKVIRYRSDSRPGAIPVRRTSE